jgi:hypothetical protein
MSAALLAKLRVKNPPKARESVEIVVSAPAKREDVSIRTKVVDMTKTSGIDRQEFMRNIASREVAKRDEPLPPTPAVQEKPPAPKKRKRRLKLVEEKSGDEPKTPTATATTAATPATTAATPATTAAATTGAEPVEKKLTIRRKTKKPIGVVLEGPASMLRIGNETLGVRIGKKEKDFTVKASSYYMNNREIFVNFMSSLFGPYKEELRKEAGKASCTQSDDTKFSPMPHQKIVRDYINLYTPYRGLLLYHGLGSGKTCSSVAIAEGIKSDKQIIVMTPASLRMNYIEELKKCGDDIYRKNQFWEFISTGENPELVEPLSHVLSLSVEYIKKHGGAWMVDITKPANFEKLSSVQKTNLDEQLNEMIRYKYKFINYNGLRESHLAALTNNFTKNPFDNAVVIIDEAHNFVSRIVSKIGKSDTISGRLYEYLMNAQNTKIVMLTGTPIINYPNEIGIMFNILRGKIKTWYFKLTINKERKVSQEYFMNLFKSTILGGNIMDYLEYKPTSTTLVITRNPFGFVNKTKKGTYEGVRIGERGDISDDAFVALVTKILSKNDITVNPAGTQVQSYKALPDKLDDFKAYFIDSTNEVKNMGLFKRRILGLASYFRSAQENLMPRFEKTPKYFHIVKIPMSDFQFGVYEEARVQERKTEQRNARKKKRAGDNLYEETVSTYRIFSRAFCNFVFPRPDIKRPMPTRKEILETTTDDLETAEQNERLLRDDLEKSGKNTSEKTLQLQVKRTMEATIDEDLLDGASATERLNNVDGRYDADELAKEAQLDTTDGPDSYEEDIKEALKQLENAKGKYLSPEGLETYSPKFLNILENITDDDHRGLHLIYSQFRTLEGIGVLKLVLEANGFARFKIKKTGEQWVLDIPAEDKGKPTFALYTGTETSEEKEIIRNVFNGAWKYIPTALAEQLEVIASNNLYGEIIKVLMITASGAEGISLKNVRYVHITEPYWHPVRIEQVIGRARRICSHQDLPEALRTVEVFMYLMTFSQKQLNSDESIELRLKDKSKLDNLTPITSDEALYETATIKEEVNVKILQAVKEASIDCALHSRAGDKEQLKCFNFGSVNSSKFSYQPSIDQEESDTVADKNKTKITWKAVELKVDGIKYAFNKLTGEMFDLDSYNRGQPVQVGTLSISGEGKNKTYKIVMV